MKRVLTVTIAVLLAASMVVGQGDEKGAKPITGQCHCGQVKYRAEGAIVKSSVCDCRGCQRATGALAAPFITVRRANFTITAGKAASFRATSGEKCDGHGVWHFCAKCGAQLYWLGDKGKDVDIFAGTLDDTSLFQPKKK